MENILVIGNGFDIAHGLNTRYSDFINFCNAVAVAYQNNKNQFVEQLELELNCVFKEKSVLQKAKKYFMQSDENSNSHKFMELCLENYWLDYVNVNKEFIGEKWSDFEYVIAEQIEMLSYISNHFDLYTSGTELVRTKYSNKLVILFDKIREHGQSSSSDFHYLIEQFKKFLVDELDNLTWMLEIYLTRFLNTKTKTLELFETLPVTKLISFNYTETFFKMYHQKTVKAHYIHGTALKDRATENNNMVFGIGTEIKNTSDDDQYNYVEFQKYYQRITKKTGNEYTKWLSTTKPFLVYFFGHSLDIVDSDIIRNLIYCKKSKVIIFYYNQEAMKALTINLVKILGKDDLIQFTNEEKILFFQTDNVEGVKEVLHYADSREFLEQYNNRSKIINEKTKV